MHSKLYLELQVSFSSLILIYKSPSDYTAATFPDKARLCAFFCSKLVLSIAINDDS